MWDCTTSRPVLRARRISSRGWTHDLCKRGDLSIGSTEAASSTDLPEQICKTRETQTLRCETVIQALDRMSRRIAAGEFTDRVADPVREQVRVCRRRLTQEALRLKVRTELGENWEAPHASEPFPGQPTFTVQNVPLGVILHIAAGNMDALPAWSVIEGLLTGNINILKLPQADKGLTIEFFRMLTEQTPELQDFVYIFDTPSTDIAGIRRLAAVADGISVWGGDAAVSAVRQLAPVGCKLIEWGHRLSFCYISGEPPAEELTALASHILQARQLLCSSCQVIYLDTDDRNSQCILQKVPPVSGTGR